MTRGRQRLAALGAVLLALAGCGKPPVEARPAMWRVSDGDTTIYLLGSIHLLPANVRWRTPIVERAIAESDTLVLESSPDEQTDFRAIATGVGLKPAADRVSPGKRPVLEEMIARSGASRETLDSYKDWALATTLAAGDAIASGADTRNGVEAELWSAIGRAARDARRCVRLLEQRGQASDHPILATMAETRYLKCFIIQVL